MARQRRVRTSLDAPGRDTARSRELRELRSRCTAASSSANMAGLSTRSKKGPSSVQKYSPKDLEAWLGVGLRSGLGLRLELLGLGLGLGLELLGLGLGFEGLGGLVDAPVLIGVITR